MSMPRRFSLLLLALAIAPFAFAAAPAKKPTFAPVNYRHRTLANGIEVYSIENHATPTEATDGVSERGCTDGVRPSISL